MQDRPKRRLGWRTGETNVAGIVMFLAQGLPPRSWRLTGGILAVWSVILLLLAGLVVGRVVLGVASRELVNRLLQILPGP